MIRYEGDYVVLRRGPRALADEPGCSEVRIPRRRWMDIGKPYTIEAYQVAVARERTGIAGRVAGAGIALIVAGLLAGCTVCTVERDTGGRVFRIRNGRAVLDEHGMVREIESKGVFEVKVDKVSIEK